MAHELTTSRIPDPDDAAHYDGLLMHELTVVNSLLGHYVLRYLDADAGRADPITPPTNTNSPTASPTQPRPSEPAQHAACTK